jgi:phytoene dehydrogenase-like protein
MGKFPGLAELSQEAPNLSEVFTQTPIKEISTKPGRKPTGKSSNPEYETAQLLLKKTTKKAAKRFLEDQESSLDLSDLVEMLLISWIKDNGQR